MSKELRQALYRARATMAEGSSACSNWASASSHGLMGFQQIDCLMQDGVEDADKALIDYEHTHIFHLWVCPDCGTYQFPEPDPDGSESTPECHCHFFPPGEQDGIEMEKVMVERMD